MYASCSASCAFQSAPTETSAIDRLPLVLQELSKLQRLARRGGPATYVVRRIAGDVFVVGPQPAGATAARVERAKSGARVTKEGREIAVGAEARSSGSASKGQRIEPTHDDVVLQTARRLDAVGQAIGQWR